MTEPNYLTTPQIAKLLGVSPTTVKNWRLAGCSCIEGFGRADGFGFLVVDVVNFMQDKKDKRRKSK